MFVHLLPRKKRRSEDTGTGKNVGSVRNATAGHARQVEELHARAFVSQRGSSVGSSGSPGSWGVTPNELWGIQYIYGVARLVLHRLAFCVTFGLLKGTGSGMQQIQLGRGGKF
jgi:hypothetical protein